MKAIFKKYPQLVSIGDALDAYREGLPITTRCLSSSQILKVTEVVATGTLWITCGNGCTNFRAKRKS